MTFTAAMKRLRVGERVVRRNPVYYGRFRRLFRQLADASVDTRISWTNQRLATVLRAARETEYGRKFDGPIESWPILEKESIRAAPRSFVRGRAILAAPAATSGTTGTPLRLWRSLSSLAAEQAAIDALVAAKGIDLATCRTAVLRGD